MRLLTSARCARLRCALQLTSTRPRRLSPSCSVVAAITAQVQNGIHLQQNCMISQPMLELLDELKLCAPKGLTRFFFNCARTRALQPRAAPCAPTPYAHPY